LAERIPAGRQAFVERADPAPEGQDLFAGELEGRPGHPWAAPLGRGSSTTTGVFVRRASTKGLLPGNSWNSRSASSSPAARARTALVSPLSSTVASGWAWRFSHHDGSPSPQPFI